MNTKVNVCGVEFKNPVLTASGTFGSGREYAEFFDLSELGGITVKGVSAEPWPGNAPPRVAETSSGMLNAIGLQNGGVCAFLRDDLPFLRQNGTRVIVNVCGHTIEEYARAVDMLRGADGIDLLELNISCPNLEKGKGGLGFGTDAKLAERTVRAAKDKADKPLIVKLSPNVTDITEIARAAEAGGADGISLINTLMAMKIDIKTRKPLLANRTGGLSGPAVKPVAVRMVYDVYKAVKLPIIGMGGISAGDDAIEFLLAGARAVAVGMASFRNPNAAVEIVQGIKRYMNIYGVEDVNDLVGAAHLGNNA